MRVKNALGRWGEARAREYIESIGYRVLDVNWRCREGELDLVAQDGGCLVVIEVKTRRSVRSGHPLEAVTPKKLAGLRLLSALWLRAHQVVADGVRVDIVGVLLLPGRDVEIAHVIGATW